MYTVNRELVKKKYKLHMLRDIENYVADKVSVQVPFNNYVTGYCAFTHKAGIHAKAILNNPETYEVRSSGRSSLSASRSPCLAFFFFPPFKIPSVDNSGE